MTTVLPAPSPDRFLSLLPHLAGCTPRESLVLVPFHGTRSIGVLRLDLPHDADLAQYAATAIGMVCRVRDADALAIVVYADTPFVAARSTHRALVDRVRERARDCGLAVHGAHLVAADGWGSCDGDDGPRPLGEIAPAAWGDAADDVSADQRAGAALPKLGKAARRRVAEAIEELAPLISERGVGGTSSRTSLDFLTGVFEDALSWDPADLHPAEAAVLTVTLATPLLRDVALTQWSADLACGQRTLEWQLRWQRGERAVPDEPLRLAGDGPRPDPERLRRALELTRYVAAGAPARYRAGALASAGWISWALGNSTHAGWYVERALVSDPEHGLAGLLREILDAAHLPAWAFERAVA
ncbi:DUF4192 family protein [Microbacterium sediminis]|uniref:Uncharacterized protein n=1 Tax=Microbacterium sediminis TaxID=904291 RepID=A0A1B9NHN8_9MICO|nr:DUF4192 family protein [Microbacterium sediminis]OCG76118.1 hypothetical protein A7J15_12590 [Microbacterium sediminis]QBR73318.1 DUF4192 family protein [Microbacterium sediminis]